MYSTIYLDYAMARLVEGGRMATYVLEIIDWGKQSTLSHARLHGQGGLAAQLENFAWVWESLRRSIEYMNTLITPENHRFIVAAAEAAADSSLVLTSLFTVSVVVQLGLQCKCYLTRGQSSVSTLNT